MECWSRMPDFDDLDARIEALCARATSPHPDARLVVEIEDLLAEGYVCALRGDRLTRNLQLRFEELVDEGEYFEIHERCDPARPLAPPGAESKEAGEDDD